jgi:uncharacterized membrane protein
MNWSHLATSALPAFLASLVEFVEALTIVVAVGVTRGWRSAGLGAAAGVALLIVLVLAFGPALALVPIGLLQIVVGILLLFFGLRWLRKAVLRSAGAVALHDETRAFEKQRTALAGSDGQGDGERIDALGVLTSFKAVVLEGLEVVFIVVAVGATAGALIPASAGAVLAGAIVVGAGFAVRGPLARVPENALKFVVGLLLSAFGTFWTGEGLGAAWPGDGLAILGLIAGYGIAAALALALARGARAARQALE